MKKMSEKEMIEKRMKDRMAEKTMRPEMMHPGFAKAQNKIASKEGVSKKAAGAILAASTRNASAKAKKENPALKKVK